MKNINLKKYYYPICKKDTFVEVPDEVADAIVEESRAENANDAKQHYHCYSLNASPGIEHHFPEQVISPEDILMEKETEREQEAARALFGGSGSSENMPSTELTDDDFTDGKIDTLTLLVKCGLAASKGEGRRLVQQGGISVNDEKVTDFATAFEKAVFAGDGAIIRKGKKVFHKALVK